MLDKDRLREVERKGHIEGRRVALSAYRVHRTAECMLDAINRARAIADRLEDEVRGDNIARRAEVTDDDVERWATKAAHYRAVADGAAAEMLFLCEAGVPFAVRPRAVRSSSGART